MLRRCLHLMLALALCAGWALAQKKLPESDTQPRGTLIETQGEPGEDAQDQVVMYRFRLAAADAGLRLAVTNCSDDAGLLTLEGNSRKVDPGETVVLEQRETAWTGAESVVVKASRRLRLSLRSSERNEDIALPQNPKASVYEVLSLERAPATAGGRLELLTARGKFAQTLAAGGDVSEAAQALRRAAGDARGLLLLYHPK